MNYQNYQAISGNRVMDRNNFNLPKIASKDRSTSSKHPYTPTENVSAKSWLCFTTNYQHGFKSNLKQPIASLTKIMTAICTIEMCKKYNMSLQHTYFKITFWSVNMNGTTANLQPDAWISIQDLIYGLMLPSGNDAAMVLAENIGAVLYFDRMGNKSLIQGILFAIQKEIKSIDLTEDQESVKCYLTEFINCMNRKSKMLKMLQTHFSNPHGLDNINNYSSCQDILIMSQYAMKQQIFRKIVRTSTYRGLLKYLHTGKVICKPINWTNTNKLLNRSNIYGIKTGITPNAGGCLSTSFMLEDKIEGVIIVLGCKSTEARFKDTLQIVSWIKDEINSNF